MRDTILTELETIEKEHGVKILYAIESGSRGWGFESTDSDYDVRFIYQRPLEWYIRVDEQKDTLDLPIDEVLDINGWDISKVIKLMAKSNSCIFEWLSSPITYRDNEALVQQLKEVADYYYRPKAGIYHYINLAKNSMKYMEEDGSIRIKKFFYALRPVMASLYIERYKVVPPMNLMEMMAKLTLDKGLVKEIQELILYKQKLTEADTFYPSTVLKDFVVDHIQRLSEEVVGLPKPQHKGFDKANETLRAILLKDK